MGSFKGEGGEDAERSGVGERIMLKGFPLFILSATQYSPR